MLKRVDALEVNFVDSAARQEFKMKSTTGVGEARIYIGHDEEICDEFFQLDKVQYFFSKKSDLLEYLEDAHDEFMNPTQDYRGNISEMYTTLSMDTINIEESMLKFTFRKTYDNQNRYFIVLTSGKDDYKHIRDICLPRVTRYSFIKFVDDTTGRIYIYLKPQYFNAIEADADPFEEEGGNGGHGKGEQAEGKKQYREKQTQYRNKLLEAMPACPFTHIADERLLVACHIKPYSKCDENEKYDFHNGITMTPTYHVLFDLGLISFDDNFKLLVSPFLSNRTQQLLNISPGDEKRLQNASKQYVKYHRENIFCKLPANFVIEDSSDGQGYSISYEG